MFCSECGNEMKETREAVKEEFKGQEFEIRGIRHYACDACGETSFDADALDELYTRLDEKYRELHGFLTPREIKELRKACGVTQAQFERMIGVKTPTCSRWESGAVMQSTVANNLMWLIKDVPCAADALKRKAEIPAAEPACAASAEWNAASPRRRNGIEYV